MIWTSFSGISQAKVAAEIHVQIYTRYYFRIRFEGQVFVVV